MKFFFKTLRLSQTLLGTVAYSLDKFRTDVFEIKGSLSNYDRDLDNDFLKNNIQIKLKNKQTDKGT